MSPHQNPSQAWPGLDPGCSPVLPQDNPAVMPDTNAVKWLRAQGVAFEVLEYTFTEIGAGYAIGPFGGNPAARYWTFDLADR